MTREPRISRRWKWLIGFAAVTIILLVGIFSGSAWLLNKAERAARQENWTDVETTLRLVWPFAATDPRYHFLMARVLLSRGDDELALQHFAQVPVDHPHFRETCRLAAPRLVRQNRWGEAEALMGLCLTRWPNESPIKLELARLYFQQDRKEEARSLLWDLFANRVEPVRMLFLIWAIDFDPFYPLERLALLESAYDRSPEHYESRRSLAQCYLELNQPERARPLLDECLADRQHDLRARSQLIQCHLAEGKVSLAVRLLKDTSELDRNWESLRADVALADGDVAAAMEHRTRARQLEPGEPQVHFQLGQLFQQMGRGDEARDAMEKYRELQGAVDELRMVIARVRGSASSTVVRDPALYAKIADFFETLGRPREALAWYDQALLVAPGFPLSRDALARIGPAHAKNKYESKTEPWQAMLDSSVAEFDATKNPMQAAVKLNRGTGVGTAVGRATTVASTAKAPASESLPHAGEQSPVQFRDVAREVGIRFQFEPRRQGEFFMGETTGGGGGWLDFDADGWLDLYLVQGCRLPHDPQSSDDRNQLFRNRGDGTFEPVTDSAAVGDNHYGQGLAAGDIDNDGFTDLYVSNYGPDVLFRNNGDGTFSDVTADAGTDCPLYGTSCAFGDLDCDGDLDLYVANYIVWNDARPPFCRGGSNGVRGYCGAEAFAGQPDVLYRNDGDGHFSDISLPSGIGSFLGRGLGVVIADLDNDRLPDIYVANDRDPCYYFQNRGGLRFEENGLVGGCAVNGQGQPTAAMGVGCGDYDGDGNLDIFITNFRLETNTLFRNLGSQGFVDQTRQANLSLPSLAMVAWGTEFVDVDNDGWLDLFIANGNTHDHKDPSILYAMEPQLFRNLGGSSFADVGRQAGEYFRRRWQGRAAAFADYDNNGTCDIAVIHQEMPIALLQNSSDHENHWLGVELIGRQSNRSGLGVRVRADVEGRLVVREATGGGSYLAANDRRIVIGLGKNQSSDRLTIEWPAGRKHEVSTVTGGRYLRFVEE